MSKQKIQLSDHFNYSRLLRFVLPCIGTMLFTSMASPYSLWYPASISRIFS